MIMIPTEAELGERIRRHLAARPGNGDVAVAWTGYLAGLIEWGLIEPDAHLRLVSLLPRAEGAAAVDEILVGLGAQEP